MEDRFETSKPQFRRTQERASKIVLDERFASVLTDPRFQLDVKDKYGRRNNTSSKKHRSQQTKEDLSEFYSVEEPHKGKDFMEEQSNDHKSKEGPNDHCDDDEADGELIRDQTIISTKSSTLEKAKDKVSKEKKLKVEENAAANDQSNSLDPVSRIAYLTALSRGELDVSSSSSDDDKNGIEKEDSDSEDDSDSNNLNGNIHGKAGILDPSTQHEEEIELTDEDSPFLAVQNIDWSNVRAVDIFTIMSSFTPPGSVKRVAVYPSDFGKERMAKDAMFGPIDVWKKEKTSSAYSADEDNSDNEESELIEKQERRSDENEQNDGQYMPNENGESDFDPEKLRAYEASRLKYYFAVVQFSSTEYANIVYKELDGMEFEHSSAAVDLRIVPTLDVDEIIHKRELRDEATGIPSNYQPPEFVVSALQQSNVQCTWDMGNPERDSVLTKYTSGQTWNEIAEGDDLKAYVASDNSSDEKDSDNEDDEKASSMRKLLGLESEDDNEQELSETQDQSISDQSIDKKSLRSEDESDDEEHIKDHPIIDNNDDHTAKNKEATFFPGQVDATALPKNMEGGELTPWEQYQEKRKQKRREKRQVARLRRKEVNHLRKGKTHREGSLNILNTESLNNIETADCDSLSKHKSAAELELLVAGEDNEELERDYDMRGLDQIEKFKNKKLRGARKRKAEKILANVSGTEFKIDITDDRFNAVLDGSDGRFGIDRTDPNFKETNAMREILAEQSRRRKKNRNSATMTVSTESKIVPDVSAEGTKSNSVGSAALSALVTSIKLKVQKS